MIASFEMDQESRRCLVRWHEYSNSVTVAVQTLRYDEELLDVTIACEGHTIRAHKLVLAASSQYFRHIFKEFPCEHPTIVIDNMKFENLLSILHFMYYGQVLVEEKIMSSLLAAAASLAVIGLSYISEALVDDKKRQRSETSNDLSSKLTAMMVPGLSTENKSEITIHSISTDCDNKEVAVKSNSDSNCDKTTNIDTKAHQANDSEMKDTKDMKLEEDLLMQPSNKRQKFTCDNIIATQLQLKDSCSEDALSSLQPLKMSLENGSSNSLPDTENDKSTSSSFSDMKYEIKQSESTKSTEVSKINNHIEGDWDMKLYNNINKPEENKNLNEIIHHLYEKNKLDIDIYKEEDTSSADIEDFDLGPPPLPMNHPAVIAAAASTSSAAASVAAAIAVAATNGGSNAFKSLASSLNPINYAALITANAKGVLSNSNLQNYLMNQGGNTLSSWIPTTELSPSPSPPVGSSSPHPPGYIHPTAMSQQDLQATLDQYQRKLAFHEPRPCPTCKRMYRDAATLRTHIAIMHSEGKEPFACTCGALFSTKYDMYQHRKNGHR